MLLKGVGQSTEYHEMDVPTIAKAMAYLRAAS
jgi:hypothetical protein